MTASRKRAPTLRRAAGGVVYRTNDEDMLCILAIRDRQGRWTLPKGHLDEGETEAEAALREVQEETGVTGEIVELLRHIEYPITRKGQRYIKRVTFFLMKATSETITPQEEEIREAAWLPVDEALRRIAYEQVRAVVHQAIDVLADDWIPYTPPQD